MAETLASERTTTFTKFEKLPAEIRLQIWADAVYIPNPRDFKVILGRPYASPFKYVSPPPALLHTCHDSRQALLMTKQYSFHYPKHLIRGSDRCRRLEGPEKVYFDVEEDTLFFQTQGFNPWSYELDHFWDFLKYEIVDVKGGDEFGKDTALGSAGSQEEAGKGETEEGEAGEKEEMFKQSILFPGELEVMVVKMETVYQPNTLFVVRKRSYEYLTMRLFGKRKTYANDEKEVLERAGYVVGNKVGEWTFKSVEIVKHWGPFNSLILL